MSHSLLLNGRRWHQMHSNNLLFHRSIDTKWMKKKRKITNQLNAIIIPNIANISAKQSGLCTHSFHFNYPTNLRNVKYCPISQLASEYAFLFAIISNQREWKKEHRDLANGETCAFFVCNIRIIVKWNTNTQREWEKETFHWMSECFFSPSTEIQF